MSHEFWVLAIGGLVSFSCSLIGVLLVLRRQAMMGDAISHSVLLGLVAAFLLTGSRDISVMFMGAVVVGLATALLIDLLHQSGHVQQDASIGIVFTAFFALAVLLISGYGGLIDLDQECVLYGEIAFAPFDALVMGGHDLGPRTFWALLLVSLANLIFVTLGYSRLKVICFNASFAATVGISVTLWHYGLMALVSSTTVAAFDAVGAILVVALIVIPANTAYLHARSLRAMFVWAVVWGWLATVLGYWLARHMDVSIAASIAVMSGVIFAVVLMWNQWRAGGQKDDY